MLGHLTPSEVALLYADRFLPSFPEPFEGSYRVPLSGRYLDVESLAQFMADTCLGALLQSDSARLAVQRRLKIVRQAPAVLLQLGPQGGEWPHDSPEERVLRWLARAGSREGWLDDAWRHVMLPAVSGTPEREACDHALGRVERLGIVVPLIRRVLRFIKVREYDVADRHRRTLARADEGEVRTIVACRAAVPASLQLLVREAWRSAVALRTDER